MPNFWQLGMPSFWQQECRENGNNDAQKLATRVPNFEANKGTIFRIQKLVCDFVIDSSSPTAAGVHSDRVCDPAMQWPRPRHPGESPIRPVPC